jgi:predicted RNA-binding Zn-ribbon protein involved in translation (DUF1610 family)
MRESYFWTDLLGGYMTRKEMLERYPERKHEIDNSRNPEMREDYLYGKNTETVAEGWVLTSPRLGRSGVFTTKDDAEKVKNWYMRYAPPHYEIETSLKIVNATANDGELDNHSKGILLGSETVGSPSPSGPSSVPEPAEATGSEPSNEQFSAEVDKEFYENVSGSLCPNCGRDGDLGHFSTLYWCDDCGNEGCDGCTDDCDCETKEAESKNMSWVIGLTALGVGVAALGYSDKILALFDRFKK